MKKKAIALALSLALMLTIFVPGTLAMGTESGKDTNTASQQVSVPQKTETPSEPVNPADPSDPSDPVKPVDPSDPSTPTEEGKPVETTAPTGESKPEETTAPTEEGKPEETTAPTEDDKPEETTATTEVTDPTETTEEDNSSKSFSELPKEVQDDIMAAIYRKEGLGGIAKFSIHAAAAPAFIEAKWFSFQGGVEKPASFNGVYSGEISASMFPTIDGYVFDHAEAGGARLRRIGQIEYNSTIYVYYVWQNESEFDLVAQVLDTNDTIKLYYAREPVAIQYTVTMNGQTTIRTPGEPLTVMGIPHGEQNVGTVTVIPADTPDDVSPGNSFSFAVTDIPRGYKAEVYVNGEKQETELGISPTYHLQNGDTIVRDTAPYTSHYTYEATATNGGQPQEVEVRLIKNQTPSFTAEDISTTPWFNKDYGILGGGNWRRADSWVNGASGWTGEVDAEGSLTWRMETRVHNSLPYDYWLLDALEINETTITLPFANGDANAQVTVLPSGTVVRVLREEVTNSWRPLDHDHYIYTITVSNCYENLVVTAGNYNDFRDDQEYMPFKYVGVETLEYQNNSGEWIPTVVGHRVSSNEINNRRVFRFKLLPGYGEPTVKLNEYEIDAVLDQGDGYYYVRNFRLDEYPVLIQVEALPIDVTVVYGGGDVTNATSIPTDANHYSVNDLDQIQIPLMTPVDPTGKKMFTHWTNGGEEYHRNDVVSLEDLEVDEHGQVFFTAQWVDVESAEFITFEIVIAVKGQEDNPLQSLSTQGIKGEPAVLDINAGSLATWLAANQQYEVDKENTIWYYDKIDPNAPVYLYVKERTATINYYVAGTGGKVDPQTETLVVTNPTASGSTPTPDPGFRFIGWYTDVDCTTEVDETWVEANNMLIPKKTGELWEDATYYAKFDYAYADLTITAAGIEGTYGQQGTIYRVHVNPADKTTAAFDFQIAINGNGSKTITDLPYGEYTVTPLNDWSWRYSDQTPTTVTPSQGNDGRMVASVTFHYSLQNHKWLSGNAYYGN